MQINFLFRRFLILQLLLVKINIKTYLLVCVIIFPSLTRAEFLIPPDFKSVQIQTSKGLVTIESFELKAREIIKDKFDKFKDLNREFSVSCNILVGKNSKEICLVYFTGLVRHEFFFDFDGNYLRHKVTQWRG